MVIYKDMTDVAGFQSSPVPKDGCNKWEDEGIHHTVGFNPHPSRRTGATFGIPMIAGHVAVFQSSPVPKDGCNLAMARSVQLGISFQSSPVPKDGCNEIERMLAVEAEGFNPHPSRRTGATGGSLFVQPGLAFQSSPVPKDGCNR